MKENPLKVGKKIRCNKKGCRKEGRKEGPSGTTNAVFIFSEIGGIKIQQKSEQRIQRETKIAWRGSKWTKGKENPPKV